MRALCHKPGRKEATILPVYKKECRSNPANYRPVSLTCILCKILEHIINRHILDDLDEHRILVDAQHGFRKRRSCGTQLILTCHDLAKAAKWTCLSWILLKLLTPLPTSDSSGSWKLWHRWQPVRMDTVKWLTFTTNIPKIISFADDTRLYTPIYSVDDCDSLQSDLQSVYDWAHSNNMVFNSGKFNHLCFSASSDMSVCSNAYISPEMNLIAQHEHIKDLGVFMSADCSFDHHISVISKKCSSIAGWILRTFTSRDRTPMLTLFKSIVLSRLDFGCQLWSPHQAKHINSIEKVQRSFTKHISGMYSLQGRIYYEANEASASGPHQNFNAVSNAEFFSVKNL